VTAQDYLALLPLIILASGAILLLLSIAVKRHHVFTTIVAFAALTAAFISLFFQGGPAIEISNLLVVDRFSSLFTGMIIFASAIILLLSHPYIETRAEDIEEYYILLLLATVGSITLVSSRHFMTFFLGLELLSTSLYVLLAFFREREHSIEAGIKYLILAAVSSALILFGMALVYATSGTMYFPELGQFIAAGGEDFMSLAGYAFMLGGIGFKLALVPFHMWTPDVYEGAPAPVSALIATVSKAGVFAFLLRFISESNGYSLTSLMLFLGIISAASMLLGNLLALLEKNVKKILAFSSIAHLGYLLVAFLTAGDLANEASAFYLAAYIITITGAFGIVSYLSGLKSDASDLEEYKGLFWRKPWIAAAFTIMLFSLAGLPLTAGFVSKFYVLLAGVDGGLWWLVIILIVGSTIGLFYYLRIIVTMFTRSGEDVKKEELPAASPLQAIVFFTLSALLIFIGVYPSVLIRIVSMIGGAG